jgi:hypothetical protein
MKQNWLYLANMKDLPKIIAEVYTKFIPTRLNQHTFDSKYFSYSRDRRKIAATPQRKIMAAEVVGAMADRRASPTMRPDQLTDFRPPATAGSKIGD